MSPRETPTVLLIGGGTGGHVYPLLAIGERLRPLGVRLVSVASDREIDADVLRAPLARGEIDALVPIPARPFGLHPKVFARLVRSWSPSVNATVREIERAPGPVVAVSTGGFVSVPACRACRKLGVPLALVALDVPPGKATMLTSRWADHRLNAAPVPLKGWKPVGPLIRAAARPSRPRSEAAESLGLDPARPTLVVFGGSQGARTLNRFLVRFLQAQGDKLNDAGWQVLQQSGAADFEESRAAARGVSLPVRVVPFIENVGDAWSAASVVLARAGASTVAEARFAGKPCVFMPYPFHADRHQEGNARLLVESGAAVCLRDHVDPETNLEANATELLRVLSSFSRVSNSEQISEIEAAEEDGAEDVARLVETKLFGVVKR